MSEGQRSARFVAYYRVSTARQGRSGLGLDAQRKSVADHLNGGSWRLLAEHTEIESGGGLTVRNWREPSERVDGTRQR